MINNISYAVPWFWFVVEMRSSVEFVARRKKRFDRDFQVIRRSIAHTESLWNQRDFDWHFPGSGAGERYDIIEGETALILLHDEKSHDEETGTRNTGMNGFCEIATGKAGAIVAQAKPPMNARRFIFPFRAIV